MPLARSAAFGFGTARKRVEKWAPSVIALALRACVVHVAQRSDSRKAAKNMGIAMTII